MEYAFTYAANLNIHAADAPDLSNVTTMHSMFDGAISLNSDLNHWDVSNVKNMRRLFRGEYVAGSEFNGDISSWDVSNVTQMEDMFQNATSFNGDLSSWDVSNVEDMSGMFSRSFSFNSDLNHWDVSSVTNMVGMFDSASSFNGDISSWDVSGVRDMSGMFFNATSFNQDIGGWDVGMVEWMGNVGDTSIGGMFEDARSFDQDLGRWDVRNVRNMSQMLDRSGLSRENYDALLTGWSQLTLQQYGELDAAGLEYCAESARQHLIDTFDWYISGDRLAGDCSDPGTSPVVDASKSSVTATSPHLADGVDASVVTIELVDRDGNPLSGLQEGDFEIFLVSTMDQDVQAVAGPVSEVQTSGIYTFSITDTIPESFEVFVMVGGVALDDKPEITFEPASQEPEFRPFITTWMTTDGRITIPVAENGYQYSYDIYWESTVDSTEQGWLQHQTQAVTLDSLQMGTTYRVEIKGTFPRLDFTAFDAASTDSLKLLSVKQWGGVCGESMEYAFARATDLEIHAADAPDLRKVTSMKGMFAGAASVNSDFNHWDVSSVTNMESMFESASAFNGDISSWDVSGVLDMSGMFFDATSFNGDISSWDVSSVTQMARMFQYATSFSGDLSSWNVGNVEDMSAMFASAASFNGDISGWNVSNVRYMPGMFNYAETFNQDIGDWDVSNVEDMGPAFDAGGMFEGASSFDQDLGRWDVRNVKNMRWMLDHSGLSRENYDALLTGWSQLALQQSVRLDAAGLEYCAEPARQHLIDMFDWEISGDRLAGDCSDPGTSPVVDASKSSVTATSPHLADGVDASVVTIELVDRDGNPLSGLQEGDFEINLVSNMDQDVRAVAGPVSEVQTSGIYTFSITSPAEGSLLVSVTIMGEELKDQPTVIFDAPVQQVDPALTKIIATGPHLADGMDRSVVTVQVVDEKRVPVSGLLEKDFRVVVTGSARTSTIRETNKGIYQFGVTNRVAETVELTVTIQGIRLLTEPKIQFEYPEQLVSSDLSDLLVTSPHLADGEDASTVTILLKDVEDKWISGLDPDVFTLDVSDGSLAGSLSETETGQYQFQVTSTIATSVRVTVTVKGVRLRAAPVILFEPVPKPVPDPPVIYSVTGNNNNITLTWNPVRESYIRGYQIYRGNEPHNMVLIGQAGPASDSFEDSQSSETALFYRISAVNTDGVEGPLSDYIVFYNSAIVAGHTTWKLVSTPLQNSVQNLEQTTLFGFSNQYELAAELQPSRGYWIKSKTISEETVPVTGTGLLSSTLMLRKGWNLIGSLSAPVSVNSISDPGRILTAAPVYGFSADGYQRTDKLLPNQGYWIYASESGEIEMRIQEEISEESNHLKAAKAIVAEDSPPDIWIDFSNDRQSEKLYIREFPGSEEESMRFMLPPEPPSPVLDVRTSGGLNLVQSGSERIRLQSETYPVRVTLHGVEKNSEYTWRFVLKDGIDEHVVDLIPGEPMMITQQYDRIEMVKIRMEEAITETRMLPGYPNPFNPAAIIQYQLKVSGDIKIEVYDSIGRRVQVLADGFQPSGQHQVSFHAGHLSTGVYIVRFVTGTGIQQQKITLIK